MKEHLHFVSFSISPEPAWDLQPLFNILCSPIGLLCPQCPPPVSPSLFPPQFLFLPLRHPETSFLFPSPVFPTLHCYLPLLSPLPLTLREGRRSLSFLDFQSNFTYQSSYLGEAEVVRCLPWLFLFHTCPLGFFKGPGARLHPYLASGTLTGWGWGEHFSIPFLLFLPLPHLTLCHKVLFA